MPHPPATARTAAIPHPDFSLVVAVALGLALALTGLGLILTVVVAIYGGAPKSQIQSFRLGLAGACLLSGFGQIAVLAGTWLIWRAMHGQRD
jgi:hypothetical protein